MKKVITMTRLRSCSYCGKVHATDYNCGKLPKTKKNNTEADRFRWGRSWRKKREEIKHRDKFLCQICIRNLYGTINQYNFDNLSVHHGVPLEEDINKGLVNKNLLTVCSYHHEMAESGKIPRKVILDIAKEQESKNI